MSARPMRATAAARARSLPALAGARVRALRLVAPVRARARRTPFVVIIVSLLSVGLVGLIVISTHLQDQAFALAKLHDEAKTLQLKQEQLTREVDALDSPAAVAQKAVGLGMVPNTNPVFLRPSDGAVIGTPAPAIPGSNVRQVDR